MVLPSAVHHQERTFEVAGRVVCFAWTSEPDDCIVESKRGGERSVWIEHYWTLCACGAGVHYGVEGRYRTCVSAGDAGDRAIALERKRGMGRVMPDLEHGGYALQCLGVGDDRGGATGCHGAGIEVIVNRGFRSP